MVPSWLVAPQPPFHEWWRLLTRTALAVFVTATIVTVIGLPLEAAAWSTVAVITIMGFNAGASVAAGLNRMQGSIVGCLSGAICVVVFLPWLWFPVVVVIAVVLSLTLCRLLRIGAGFRLGGALAGFFVFVPGSHIWETVGWRLLATLIGIGIAEIVVIFVWPARSDANVRDGIALPIRQSTVVVDAALARWLGEAEPQGAEAARAAVAKGTGALAVALTDRSHEPSGAWPPSTYAQLLAALNEAMLAAGRLDRVAQFRDGDSVAVYLAEPFNKVAARCREAALQAADEIEAGKARPRAESRVGIADLQISGEDISRAIQQIRDEDRTRIAPAHELQRLFSVALLLECWADAVRGLVTVLSEAR